MHLTFLSRIIGKQPARRALQPLYAAIVEGARDPLWYRDCAVPDTIDGRFDMIAAVLALVLLRLESDADGRTEQAIVLITETFVDDMDGSLRQLGIGDLMVGKHVSKMMGALGGRLSAFRDAGALDAAVARNIFHDAPPNPEVTRLTAERLEAFRAALRQTATEALLAGRMPRP
jgi:cytochrome b pre-mRNA-processing protein 3